MIFKIVSYYDEPDCGGDYWGVDLYIDGELTKSYGDYYHDKGMIRAESFIDGYTRAINLIDYEIDYEDIYKEF